jgi:membrane associated rhomboid family serine protease
MKPSILRTVLAASFLLLAVIALLIAISAPAAARPFEDGAAAYQCGDYAAAQRLWRPLAEQGHAKAQHNLGLMYGKGEGVAQDDGAALKWFRLAALQGYVAAQISPWSLHAWGLFVLAVAIIIGLLKNRRASVAVGLLIVALVAAHVFRVESLSRPWFHDQFVGLFAFTPSRYTLGLIYDWTPGGLPAALWSPFTYTFLHGDGSHLFGNCVALFIFGRSVAWRVGTWRFLMLFAVAGAAGAFVHLIFNWGEPTPLIGASASGFGIMAATFRFVPRTEDRLKALFWPDEKVRNVPLASPAEVLMERRSLVYLFICFIIYPLGLIALIYGTLGNVALAGHIGGFALGLFGFGMFDRQRQDVSPSAAAGEPSEAKQAESLGLKLLRIGFIVLIALGIIGGLSYYLHPFL